MEEDLAITQASYVVVRLLQKFPVIRLPADQVYVKTGSERQKATLVLTIAEGCFVQFE